MKRITKLLISTILLTSSLNADENSVIDDLTLTNISFNMDDEGNLNPEIFIPLYYGSEKQFYSAIGYSSTNSQEVEALDKFSDSKNAFISSSKDLTLNYITYKSSLFGYDVSIGLESTFSDVQNNDFGYIHDSANFFGNGTDYYISFDNNTELDIKRHAIRADIVVPFGEYFSSRFFTSISPYTSIGVKQSTIFKPLVNSTGASNSSTVQDIAYSFRYDGLIKTETFFNIGLVASYDDQPLKYDIAQVAQSGGNYVFEVNTIDTNEVTTKFIAKILLNIDVLGDLNPSIGYGVEKIDRKNNTTGETISTDRTLFTLGFEKMF